MKKNVLIVIGILVLILIISVISFQAGEKVGLIGGKETLKSETPILSLVGSKVVQSYWAAARGEVTAVKDRTLTLAANGDSLVVPIKETAELITLVKGIGGLGSEPKKIELGDIKVGDEAMVQIEITADGKLQGGSVTVFLPPK